MSSKEFSPEEFMQDILTQQNQQMADFEQRIEQHEKLLLKYREELYNESMPELERLFQLERIITQFIDLLNSDKYNEGYYEYQLESTFTGFLDWKMRISERVISEYSALLNAVGVRARQASFRLTNNIAVPIPSVLSKEERDVLKNLRGSYNTQQKHTLAYYESEVREGIAKAIRAGKKPNKAIIEKPIMKRILNNKGYKERTLRNHLPATIRTELFGKIYRQVSELINLTAK